MSHVLFTVAALQIGWFGISPGTFRWTEWDFRDLPALKEIFVIESNCFGPFILSADKKVIAHPLDVTLVSAEKINSLESTTIARRNEKHDSYLFNTFGVFDQVLIDLENELFPNPAFPHEFPHLPDEVFCVAEGYDSSVLARNWNVARKNQDLVDGWMLQTRYHWHCIDPFLWYFDANIVPDFRSWQPSEFESSRPINKLATPDRTEWILEWLAFYLHDNGSSRFNCIRNWGNIPWTGHYADSPRFRFKFH